MIETEFRRTLKFEGARKKDLETIKRHTGATTDTAAVNEAVEFRARYADQDPKKIDLALWLLGEIDGIDRSSKTRTVIVEVPPHADAPRTVHHLPVPRVD